MAYNENPNPENLLEKEIEIIEEEMRQRRKSWLRSHMTAIYLIAGVAIAVLVFLGIKWYNDSHNPVSRFIKASGNNLGSSFSFQLTADKNGETVMSYDGMASFNPSKQTVSIVYEAEYTDYSYTNVIYTDGAITYKGNYYQGQWTISECSDKVQEFYDFYTDYKKGDFDGGSFLRFTGLSSFLYSQELNSFMDTVKSRLSTDSAIAKITTSRDGGATAYHYDINVKELFNLVRNKGASIFYTSTDYNRFLALLDYNAENIDQASATLDFTIDSDGYLSELAVSLDTGKNVYAVTLHMGDFDDADPEIPEGFYQAERATRMQQTER